jgi:hypothetical protein
MRHFIGHTRNGLPVYVDLINSTASFHIKNHPHLLVLAKEALSQTEVWGTALRVEHDMGRKIGYANVVKTLPNEKVVYAKVLGDDLYSRFTTKGTPPATTYITIVLEQFEQPTNYQLIDIWFGRLKPARPGSKNETVDSRQYWSEHAFLLDTQPLERHSRTETCPY